MIWNPSKADIIGMKNFVRCSKVSLAQGLVVDHTPPTIVANYDKALLWMTKKTVLMRNLSTDSSQARICDIFRLYWSLKPTDLNGGCGITDRYARLFTIAQAERDQNKCPFTE